MHRHRYIEIVDKTILEAPIRYKSFASVRTKSTEDSKVLLRDTVVLTKKCGICGRLKTERYQ